MIVNLLVTDRGLVIGRVDGPKGEVRNVCRALGIDAGWFTGSREAVLLISEDDAVTPEKLAATLPMLAEKLSEGISTLARVRVPPGP